MFAKDTRLEQYLDKNGIPWIYREDITYEELSTDWNSVNDGRPYGQVRVDSAIDAYGDLMLQGSPAPAVLLHVQKDGLDVLDGVQRLLGNDRNGKTRFCGYIIECGPTTANKIRIVINCAFASEVPVDLQWTMEAVVAGFMINGDEKAEDIAPFFNKSAKKIEEVHQRLLYERRCNAMWEDATTAPHFRVTEYATISKHADPKDFSQAAPPIKTFLEELYKCEFANGDSCRYIRDFFDIKRTKAQGKKRPAQFRARLKQFEADQIVQDRLSGARKLTPIMRVQNNLKGFLTSVKNLENNGGKIDNVRLATSLHSNYREAGTLLRKMCTPALKQKVNCFNV